MTDTEPSIKVKAFFDTVTFTAQYVIYDPKTSVAAIIDPVLDFDPASGTTSTKHADEILQYGKDNDLDFQWILETHAHADHLSAAHYLAEHTKAKTGIGAGITNVQSTFAPVFDFEPEFAVDGSQFDRLFADGDEIALGSLSIKVLATPGHTPACVSYYVENAVFIGDTLFMPDYGSARADFPGGDAATLFSSIQKLLSLPEETEVYLCHDYKAPGRDEFVWKTTIGEQKRHNIHLVNYPNKADYVAFRNQRDKGLSMPQLILPSLQINLRGGSLPPAADNGIQYLKLPLNQFSKKS